MVTSRTWFTPQQRLELWERWKGGQCVAHRQSGSPCPLMTVSSIGQRNTACSLSAGVSKPKVFRGR